MFDWLYVMQSVMSKRSIKTDIVISGGGMNGISLALALAPTGLDITVIEANDPAKFTTEKFDGKVIALAYASKKIFEKVGVWDKMSKESGEILDIRIVDDSSPLFLHYDHSDIGDQPMGYIVENRYIMGALYEGLKENKNINLVTLETLESYESGRNNISVQLKSGKEINSKLLIAADGRRSKIRELSAISTREFNYNQTAIVFTAWHEKNHDGVAVENFLPSGPFAILPMGRLDENGESGHFSSIVWTETTELAPSYTEMNEVQFNEEVRKRFGDWLGEVKLVGDRWNYPLNLIFAETYIADRMCLMGDAAHGVHPIAGQGFNLGMRDIAALADIIAETSSLGLDVGGGNVLKRYEQERRHDNLQMIVVTDFLNRLFSNNIAPIKLARRVGLAAVEKMPPLKKMFMKNAMGVGGSMQKFLDKKSS